MNHDIADFEADVLRRSDTTPVLADFWAPWCGPCKMLAPVLEKLAREAGGSWHLAKINTEEHRELAERFGIRGIPNVKLFRNGKVIAEFSGALPEPQLRQWLAEHLPSPRRDAMARARELLHQGRSHEALALLQPLLATEPNDDELATLTARAQVFSDPTAAVALVGPVTRTSAWSDAAELVRQLGGIFLAARCATDRLPATSLRDRYVAGIADLQREQFDSGLGALIEVLLEKPTFDEGCAKTACAAIFKHLGPRHAISEQHSRSFAMAVNV